MGHQVVWKGVSVTDKRTSEGKDEVIGQGEMLPDYVDEFTRFVLTQTGAVRFVEDPDPNLLPASERPAPVLKPEHDPIVIADAAGVPREKVLAQAENIANDFDPAARTAAKDEDQPAKRGPGRPRKETGE